MKNIFLLEQNFLQQMRVVYCTSKDQIVLGHNDRVGRFFKRINVTFLVYVFADAVLWGETINLIGYDHNQSYNQRA